MENNKQNFKILTIDLGNNKTNLIHSTLEKFGYKSFPTDNPSTSYDILRMEPIDLVIINAIASSDFEKEIIRDIQNLTDCGIIFLTPEHNISKMDEFTSFNLLSYTIKLGNLLNIIKEIDMLIGRLIANSSETVMLIKGKNQTRDLLAELLRLRRYNVILCQNGASAWKKLDTIEHLSLMLIDINLADMDSMDILRKARKKFSNHLPVISVSRKYDPMILQQNIANGLSDFIKAPIEKLEFELKIDLWADNVKQKREIEHQKKDIENALESFKALANATMEALVMFEDNVCVDANEEALKMFAFGKKEEILGVHILNFVPKTLSKYDQDQLLKVDVDHEFEMDLIKNDEIIFPAQIKERNIKLENRDLKVIAILDLTNIKRNENMLHQQSKLASMGEMMENIAHQWRQPLSAITISASSILISNELGLMEENELEEQLGAIIESADFLSNTINDFQNFLKADKHLHHFNLQDVIAKVLKLIDGNMKKNKITIVQNNMNTINVYSLENELVQVVLNIINNAKDILVENNIPIPERLVLINIYEDNEKKAGVIEIQDSAGGIPKNIISKIFEPYFTTKHQSQGTGLGLYMSHQMIVDHIQGDIIVSNEKFLFEGKEFYGANFKVIIPLEISQSKS